MRALELVRQHHFDTGDWGAGRAIDLIESRGGDTSIMKDFLENDNLKEFWITAESEAAELDYPVPTKYAGLVQLARRLSTARACFVLDRDIKTAEESFYEEAMQVLGEPVVIVDKTCALRDMWHIGDTVMYRPFRLSKIGKANRRIIEDITIYQREGEYRIALGEASEALIPF